jgi:hypothetical protein
MKVPQSEAETTTTTTTMWTTTTTAEAQPIVMMAPRLLRLGQPAVKNRCDEEECGRVK